MRSRRTLQAVEAVVGRSRPVSLLVLFAAVLVILFHAGDQVPPVQRLMPALTRCDGPTDARIAELAAWAHRQGLPGLQIAHVDAAGRRLACGSGWSRFAPLPERMQLDHRIRYASLSKLLTLALALKAIAEHQLDPQDRVIDRLPIAAELADPRMREMTVAQLMNHTAGFDRTLSGDPMSGPKVWCPERLDHLASVSLDHHPGTHFAYGNLGYCLLAQTVVHATGRPLQSLFDDELLAPLQAPAIRPARGGRYQPDEPRYFFDPAESPGDLLGFDYRAILPSGGWSGTASDLALLLHRIYGPRSALLPAPVIADALAAPPGCADQRWRACHVAGYYRYRGGNARTMFWRDGSMPGVTAFAALFEDGEVLVVLANSRQAHWMPLNDALGQEVYRLFR